MDSEKVIYRPEDCEYRVFCEICDKLCIEKYYKNYLTSQTHTNNFYKRQLRKKINLFSLN